ncbi:Transcriptional regulatory protein OmpR [Vibrio aerogenes CECT 7868]|uniref:Transcriptional regulatory protein OmpR n=1 Tax=Vibrio aerogenes CECT 7868 TaxID=1216006 RepID=A0A1M5UKL5_9VIBR|nr:response regulator [Vibrio aerogenes]SHH63517.1 Transcriptional regulatory protein OmpR [Vibrio aerogenes CECT 7868]
MKRHNHILVVDDDAEIRELLDTYLTQMGYVVSVAKDGDELHRHLEQHGYPSLILLDVMMPGDDGFSLCQTIRKTSDVPIIMLTAVSDDTEQIIGLEMGADDYIAKPFNPRQLIARIKAVLRRAHPPASEKDLPPKSISFGVWQLDTLSHRLHHQETSETYELSGSDFSLLMLFLSRPNEVLDRDTISCVTRGREAMPYERAIDVQLSRLRQRLGDDGKTNQYIKTMRGNGYIFVASVTYHDQSLN